MSAPTNLDSKGTKSTFVPLPGWVRLLGTCEHRFCKHPTRQVAAPGYAPDPLAGDAAPAQGRVGVLGAGPQNLPQLRPVLGPAPREGATPTPQPTGRMVA